MRLIDAEPIEKFIENGLNCKDPRKRFGHDAIEILTEVHYAPTIGQQESNPPLTLDELRGMDGEPVWCCSEHRTGAGGWFLVDASALQAHEFIAVGKERGIPCAGVETGYWLAYRHRPEEGTV